MQTSQSPALRLSTTGRMARDARRRWGRRFILSKTTLQQKEVVNKSLKCCHTVVGLLAHGFQESWLYVICTRCNFAGFGFGNLPEKFTTKAIFGPLCLALSLEGCQTSPIDPAPHGPDLGWRRHRVGLVSLRCISQGSRQTNDRGLLLEQSDNFRSYNSPKVCPEARSSHRCCRLGCLITTEVIKYLWPYIAHD